VTRSNDQTPRHSKSLQALALRLGSLSPFSLWSPKRGTATVHRSAPRSADHRVGRFTILLPAPFYHSAFILSSTTPTLPPRRFLKYVIGRRWRLIRLSRPNFEHLGQPTSTQPQPCNWSAGLPTRRVRTPAGAQAARLRVLPTLYSACFSFRHPACRRLPHSDLCPPAHLLPTSPLQRFNNVSLLTRINFATSRPGTCPSSFCLQPSSFSSPLPPINSLRPRVPAQ